MQHFLEIGAFATVGNSGVNLSEFDLDRFLPFLLNQAGERIGRRFEPVYRERYGLTRTQWRVIAHIGSAGAMTAATIARKSLTEKTKVSRAVAGLETAGLLERVAAPQDRRIENLHLTDQGRAVFAALADEAMAFDRMLRARLGGEISEVVIEALRELASEKG